MNEDLPAVKCPFQFKVTYSPDPLASCHPHRRPFGFSKQLRIDKQKKYDQLLLNPNIRTHLRLSSCPPIRIMALHPDRR